MRRLLHTLCFLTTGATAQLTAVERAYVRATADAQRESHVRRTVIARCMHWLVVVGGMPDFPASCCCCACGVARFARAGGVGALVGADADAGYCSSAAAATLLALVGEVELAAADRARATASYARAAASPVGWQPRCLSFPATLS
jgi:hypothetical protein